MESSDMKDKLRRPFLNNTKRMTLCRKIAERLGDGSWPNIGGALVHVTIDGNSVDFSVKEEDAGWYMLSIIDHSGKAISWAPAANNRKQFMRWAYTNFPDLYWEVI